MKIPNLQKYLKKKKISAALFFNFDDEKNPNFFYFTSFEGYGALLVHQKGPAILYVPEMEGEKARKKVKAERIRNLKVVVYRKKMIENMKRRIGNKKILAVDKSQITVELFSRLKRFFKKKKFKDVSVLCSRLRVLKNGKETAYLKKACSISDRILMKCIKNFRNFKTEADAVNFLEEETIKHGCTLAFPTIIASGPGSSQPHYTPKNIRMRKGFCVIDFGVKYKGYHSDTTRTIYLGKPSEKEKEIYAVLQRAQADAIACIRDGMICSRIYSKAARALGTYRKYFIHGLGHGLGVQIHEQPNLKADSKERIKSGMVFTIEPGVYFPGKYGIRIEDSILFDKKAEILTKIPKKLIILK